MGNGRPDQNRAGKNRFLICVLILVFQAELSKSKGTERLKDQKFDLAIKHYNRVISLLDHQETKVQKFSKTPKIFQKI